VLVTQQRIMLAYQGALLVVALVLLFFALPYGLGSPVAVLGLALIAAIAERSRVNLDKFVGVSISVLPTVFAATVFGPLAALVVSASSLLGDFPSIRRLWGDGDAAKEWDQLLKWGVYTSIRAIYGAAAGFAAVAALGLADSQTTQVVIATATAALVAEPLDLAFGALTLRLRGRPALHYVRMCAPMYAVSVCLYTPIVAALALAYMRVSPWTLPLFFLPALAAQRLFGLYQEQRQLANQLGVANTDLEEANLSFATALVTTLDARDRYTAGHSAAVAIYARDIATRMALPEEEVRKAHLAGLVHDIGKIGLPAGLLEKPGALTLDDGGRCKSILRSGSGSWRRSRATPKSRRLSATTTSV
jgi:hypothetical protein